MIVAERDDLEAIIAERDAAQDVATLVEWGFSVDDALAMVEFPEWPS